MCPARFLEHEPLRCPSRWDATLGRGWLVAPEFFHLRVSTRGAAVFSPNSNHELLWCTLGVPISKREQVSRCLLAVPFAQVIRTPFPGGGTESFGCRFAGPDGGLPDHQRSSVLNRTRRNTSLILALQVICVNLQGVFAAKLRGFQPTLVTGTPPVARSGVGMVASGHRLFVYGGWSFAGSAGGTAVSAGSAWCAGLKIGAKGTAGCEC